jgi:hypothetical protein
MQISFFVDPERRSFRAELAGARAREVARR